MDTSRMELIQGVDSDKFLALFDRAKSLKRALDYLYKTIDSQVLRNQVADLLENHYDLGRVREVYEVFGGYTNRSFAVVCEKDGRDGEYLARKYKAEALDNDVALEHALLNHILSRGFKEAARVFPARDGRTFVRLKEISQGQAETRLFAVYEYLPGEDKYTWIDNENTAAELLNLGDLMARLHDCARDFDPGPRRKAEPKAEILFQSLGAVFDELAARPVVSKFHDFFKMNIGMFKDCLERNAIPAEAYARMVETAVHGDFHAGNVKFLGEKTVGLFDFDWSKIDVRLFDICLGLVYCCTSWHVATDGRLRLDDCRYFLEGYARALEGAALPGLNEIERRHFPQMMVQAGLYLVYWCAALWYYLDPEGTNDYESIYYLIHLVRTLKWLESHKASLADLVAAGG